MDKKKIQENILLNKKRKNSGSSLKSTEDNNKNIEYYENIKQKVLEINLEKDELVASVEKRSENGKIKIEKIKTKDLKLENPWILINFYETSNINLY